MEQETINPTTMSMGELFDLTTELWAAYYVAENRGERKELKTRYNELANEVNKRGQRLLNLIK